jgi:hypothetical protein
VFDVRCRERALEAQVEDSMEKREQHDMSAGNTDGAGVAALPSIESLKVNKCCNSPHYCFV